MMLIVSEKEQQEMDYYQAQIGLSAFEIQDEVIEEILCQLKVLCIYFVPFQTIVFICFMQVITDLLRPSSRGLGISITADAGV